MYEQKQNGEVSNHICYATKIIPVDPAGDYCYWDSIKICKSWGFFGNTGELFSNTSIICLMV